jgi:hypothetical protein
MRVTRRNGRAENAKRLTENQLSDMGILRKIRQHTAPLVWAEVVGPQVSAATEVLGVDNAILRVSTKSSVWANELTFHKQDILKRLNKKLGASPQEWLIKDILFQNKGLNNKPTPDDPLPLHPTPDALDEVELSSREWEIIQTEMSGIVDEKLRAKVQKVRVADLKLRTWRLDNGWIPCPQCGDLTLFLGEAVQCTRCRLFG